MPASLRVQQSFFSCPMAVQTYFVPEPGYLIASLRTFMLNGVVRFILKAYFEDGNLVWQDGMGGSPPMVNRMMW